MLAIESILHHSPIIPQLRSIAHMTSSPPRLDNMSSTPPDLVAGTKRPADPEPSAQRVEKRKRRKHNRIIRPEEGSLFDILHENAGKMLYLIPIHWTDVHTRLLGASFVPLDPITTPVPIHKPLSPARTASPPRPSQVANALSRDLTTLVSASVSHQHMKANAIRSVMSTLFPATLCRPKSHTRLDLHFGGRVVRNCVQIPVLWRHPDSNSSFDSAITRPASSFDKIPSSTAKSTASSAWSSQPAPNQPILAYVDRVQLAALRRVLFRIVPGPEACNKANEPVAGLQRLRSKNLIPSDPDCDPHFIGMLLAMAQAHFFENSSRSSSQGADKETRIPQFEDTKVQLITQVNDSSELVVYTAIVTATFLQRFAEPTKAPGSEAERGLKIEYVKVPVWPVLGLKERLGKALGRDIAGDILEEEAEQEHMETWETREERQLRLGTTLKRTRTERDSPSQSQSQSQKERDVLGEVLLNQSFIAEEEPESGEVRLLSPKSKRRCTNPALVAGEVY